MKLFRSYQRWKKWRECSEGSVPESTLSSTWKTPSNTSWKTPSKTKCFFFVSVHLDPTEVFTNVPDLFVVLFDFDREYMNALWHCPSHVNGLALVQRQLTHCSDAEIKSFEPCLLYGLNTVSLFEIVVFSNHISEKDLNLWYEAYGICKSDKLS